MLPITVLNSPRTNFYTVRCHVWGKQTIGLPGAKSLLSAKQCKGISKQLSQHKEFEFK